MTVESLTSDIQKRFSEIIFKEKSDRDNLILEFQTATQVEYVYNIWFGLSLMKATVGARLLNATEKQYFWYYPFEPIGLGSEEQQRKDCLQFIIDELDILSRHETRIFKEKAGLMKVLVVSILRMENGKRIINIWPCERTSNFQKYKGV